MLKFGKKSVARTLNMTSHSHMFTEVKDVLSYVACMGRICIFNFAAKYVILFDRSWTLTQQMLKCRRNITLPGAISLSSGPTVRFHSIKVACWIIYKIPRLAHKYSVLKGKFSLLCNFLFGNIYKSFKYFWGVTLGICTETLVGLRIQFPFVVFRF